jgi:hypothetical protein
LLERTPPHLRRIRYLFITNRELEPASGTTHGVRAESQAEGNDMQIVDEARGLFSRETGQMPDAVNSILSYVAESVEVLELAYPRYSIATNLDTMDPASFPRLRELTAHGDYLLPREGFTVIFGPCLRRLHIDHSGTYMNYEFESIGSLAPSLTHLRFSGLLESWFAADLEVALGIREESYAWNKRPPTATGRLPSSAQKVFVKPTGPPPPTGRCGTRALGYENLLKHLYSLNEKEDRLVLLKEGDELMSSQNIDESDWLNRIAGGEGCWGVSERIPWTVIMPEGVTLAAYT